MRNNTSFPMIGSEFTTITNCCKLRVLPAILSNLCSIDPRFFKLYFMLSQFVFKGKGKT
jgi:hypothetical protein